MNALTEAVIRATDKAIKYDAALVEIARHLSPLNKNVTDGDLIACIRDLAMVARGHEPTSAKSCGCDAGAGWVCERHQEIG